MAKDKDPKKDKKVPPGQAKKQEKADGKGKGKGKGEERRTKPLKSVHGHLISLVDNVLEIDPQGKQLSAGYELAEGVVVTLNKKEATAADLLEGDNLFLVVEEGLVVAIDARRDEDEEDEEEEPDEPDEPEPPA